MENAVTKKLFSNGEKSKRINQPELAAPASVTKWKTTKRMISDWRRKPFS